MKHVLTIIVIAAIALIIYAGYKGQSTIDANAQATAKCKTEIAVCIAQRQ